MGRAKFSTDFLGGLCVCVAMLASAEEDDKALLRRHGLTGRPLARERFLKRVQKAVGRDLHRRKPGPEPKSRKR